jgi:hypothetical protein
MPSRVHMRVARVRVHARALRGWAKHLPQTLRKHCKAAIEVTPVESTGAKAFAP